MEASVQYVKQSVSGLLDAKLLAFSSSLDGLNFSEIKGRSKVDGLLGERTYTYKGRAVWKSQQTWALINQCCWWGRHWVGMRSEEHDEEGKGSCSCEGVWCYNYMFEFCAVVYKETRKILSKTKIKTRSA